MPEPKIDKDRVIECLRLISEDAKRLREKTFMPKEHYLASPDLQAIEERRPARWSGNGNIAACQERVALPV